VRRARGLVWTLVVTVSLGLCLAAGVVLFVVRPIQYGDPAGVDPVRLDIPAGTSLTEIATRLQQAGVIRHAFVFKHYGALAQFDRQVRPGEYQFVAGESYRRILERLRQGDIIQIKVTIPEGLTRREIAHLIERGLAIPSAEFVRVTEDPAILREHAVQSPTFEGYLFPDTYFFATKITAVEALEMMLQRFFTAWTPAHEERARAIGMTREQVLTLASIIEGEALLDSERPRISAVYHNRLQRDMLLQADPTVLYALGGVRRRVFYSDLLTVSPYNTYVTRGLPPGPICNPGLLSIEAALSPTPGISDLFFVAAQDGTGRHVFTRTLAEHMAAKQRADRTQAARTAAKNAAEEARSQAPAKGSRTHPKPSGSTGGD
jgi:UPF0755 protein